MGNPDVAGLLFDKDGTLFDFGASWTGVLDETLARLTDDTVQQNRLADIVGYDRARAKFVQGSVAVAEPIDVLARIWAEALGNIDANEVEDIANAVAEAAVSDGALVPAVPDLPGFLDGLRASGLRLGVATHDSEAAAIAHLSKVGALDRFDFIAGYDSGFGLKPGAGMMIAFCERVALVPGQVAMVGDSLADLGVVEASGAAMAIGVLTGPATREDLSLHADHVLDSIGDLPGLLGLGL